MRRILCSAALLAIAAVTPLAAREPGRIPLNSPVVALASADVNGDGTTEIIAGVSDGRVLIIDKPGSSSFRTTMELATGATPVAITLEESGRLPHILVATRDPGQLVVFSPGPDASFIRTTFPVRGRPSTVTIRRSSERTMKNAMVVATSEEGRDGLEIFESCYGCPCGSTFYPAGVGESSVIALDMDPDAVEEIAVTSMKSGDVTLFARQNGSTYVPSNIVDLGGTPLGVTSVPGSDEPTLAVILRDPHELVLLHRDAADAMQIVAREPITFTPRGLVKFPHSTETLLVFGDSRDILAMTMTGGGVHQRVIATASTPPRTLTIAAIGNERWIVVGTDEGLELLHH